MNKACLSAFNFGFPKTLMLSQLCVSVIALSVLRVIGIVNIPKRSPRQLAVLAVPAAFFIGNVTVGLVALQLVNIPMFSAFRRLSVLSVMLVEWLVLGKTASRHILFTVSIMVFGSFVAGLGDLSFSLLGYCLVFLNNFITAANLVSIKKASAIVSLDALPLFYYVSLISLPVVFFLSLLSGELSRAIEAINTRPDLQTPSFAFALALSAGSAFLINFLTNMCTQLTSPLTTAITGQMKNILQTVLGIFAFGYKVTALNLFGLSVALMGSALFARYKYIDAQAAKIQKLKQSDSKQVSVALSRSAPVLYSEKDTTPASTSEDEKTTLLRHTARHVSLAVGGNQSHEE